MIRNLFKIVPIGLMAVLMSFPVLGQDEASPWTSTGQLTELIDKLTVAFPELDEESLVKAAVVGIQGELGPRTDLGVMDMGSEVEGSSESVKQIKTNVIDEKFAWVRVGTVVDGLDKKLRAFWEEETEGRLQGLLLDLRGAQGGADYKPVVDFMAYFLEGNMDLIKINDQVWRMTGRSGRVDVPVVILIDEATSGPAEVIAFLFKHHKSGVVLGRPTAGKIRAYERVSIPSGTPFWLSSAPVLLPNGDPLPVGGIEPDLLIEEHESLKNGDQSMPTRDAVAVKSSEILDDTVIRGLDLLRGVVLMRASNWNGFPR